MYVWWDGEVTSNTSNTPSLRNGARRIRLALGWTEFARHRLETANTTSFQKSKWTCPHGKLR